MKTPSITTILAAFSLLLFISISAPAQQTTSKTPAAKMPGFIDENGDGINDHHAAMHSGKTATQKGHDHSTMHKGQNGAMGTAKGAMMGTGDGTGMGAGHSSNMMKNSDGTMSGMHNGSKHTGSGMTGSGMKGSGMTGTGTTGTGMTGTGTTGTGMTGKK